MLIKICGVRDPETAFFGALSGADFIGMVLTPGFARSVNVSMAKQIVEATVKGGAEPVALFVNETPNEVETICDELKVDRVQFYPPLTSLNPKLKRFYVNEQAAHLRENQDYLLVESTTPGRGVKVDPAKVPVCTKDFFLAGGLNPSNVQEMIGIFRPIGVDVSSGVEKDGVKRRDLILEFIEQVRSYA